MMKWSDKGLEWDSFASLDEARKIISIPSVSEKKSLKPLTKGHDMSCKDKIGPSFEQREDFLTEVYEAMNRGIDYEGQNPFDALMEFPLGIDKHIVVKVQFSTGGPGDWIEIICNEDRNHYEIIRVDYHYNDWFDHAELRVEENTSLYRFAEEIIESIL